jgi:hypothetical protein
LIGGSMAIIVTTNANQTTSYLNLVINVFTIFILGLFLIILYKTYTKRPMYFIIALSIYFIVLNIYILLYMNMIKDPVLTNSIHHKIINFLGVYKIFMAMFMIGLGIMKTDDS